MRDRPSDHRPSRPPVSPQTIISGDTRMTGSVPMIGAKQSTANCGAADDRRYSTTTPNR